METKNKDSKIPTYLTLVEGKYWCCINSCQAGYVDPKTHRHTKNEVALSNQIDNNVSYLNAVKMLKF